MRRKNKRQGPVVAPETTPDTQIDLDPAVDGDPEVHNSATATDVRTPEPSVEPGAGPVSEGALVLVDAPEPTPVVNDGPVDSLTDPDRDLYRAQGRAWAADAIAEASGVPSLSSRYTPNVVVDGMTAVAVVEAEEAAHHVDFSVVPHMTAEELGLASVPPRLLFESLADECGFRPDLPPVAVSEISAQNHQGRARPVAALAVDEAQAGPEQSVLQASSEPENSVAETTEDGAPEFVAPVFPPVAFVDAPVGPPQQVAWPSPDPVTQTPVTTEPHETAAAEADASGDSNVQVGHDAAAELVAVESETDDDSADGPEEPEAEPVWEETHLAPSTPAERNALDSLLKDLREFSDLPTTPPLPRFADED